MDNHKNYDQKMGLGQVSIDRDLLNEDRRQYDSSHGRVINRVRRDIGRMSYEGQLRAAESLQAIIDEIKAEGLSDIACKYCHSRIPWKDLETGAALHEMIRPDSDYGPEEWEDMCKMCYAEYKNEECQPL